MLMTHAESEEIKCPMREIIYLISFQVTAGKSVPDQCCWGKNCPLWRWYDREGLEMDPYKPTPKKRRGYCGLGGQITTAL